MLRSLRSVLKELATKRIPHSPDEVSALDTLDRLPCRTIGQADQGQAVVGRPLQTDLSLES